MSVYKLKALPTGAALQALADGQSVVVGGYRYVVRRVYGSSRRVLVMRGRA